MKREYNIAGFGGQGILFLGQVLAYAGTMAGKEATWIPSYGPEMRGGTANCVVVISDDKVRSPLVQKPDVALIFNKPSLEKYGSEIKAGGVALLVSDQIDVSFKRQDVIVCAIPAKSLAEETGAPMAVNMIMLGALLGIDPALAIEHAEAALEVATPTHLRHLVGANRVALRAGYDYALTLQYLRLEGEKDAIHKG